MSGGCPGGALKGVVHFTCTECRQVRCRASDAGGEELGRIGAGFGFRSVGYMVEIFGICAKCEGTG